MSTASPVMKNLARQLLELEANDSSDANAASFSHAAKVCERLRAPIARYTGLGGYSLLLSRSLALSQAATPSLGLLRIRPDGTLDIGTGGDKAQATLAAESAGLMLVSQLLELMVTFIGESLTKMLIRSAWQGASIDGVNVIDRKKV